jgi:hypothetical protein
MGPGDVFGAFSFFTEVAQHEVGPPPEKRGPSHRPTAARRPRRRRRDGPARPRAPPRAPPPLLPKRAARSLPDRVPRARRAARRLHRHLRGVCHLGARGAGEPAAHGGDARPTGVPRWAGPSADGAAGPLQRPGARCRGQGPAAEARGPRGRRARPAGAHPRPLAPAAPTPARTDARTNPRLAPPPGGMASRLLRSSLAAAGAYTGLAYQNTSAETGGDQAKASPALQAALSLRQQQVVGTLQRVRALVRHHVAGVSRGPRPPFACRGRRCVCAAHSPIGIRYPGFLQAQLEAACRAALLAAALLRRAVARNTCEVWGLQLAAPGRALERGEQSELPGRPHAPHPPAVAPSKPSRRRL